jgi:hypothetical protein
MTGINFCSASHRSSDAYKSATPFLSTHHSTTGRATEHIELPYGLIIVIVNPSFGLMRSRLLGHDAEHEADGKEGDEATPASRHRGPWIRVGRWRAVRCRAVDRASRRRRPRHLGLSDLRQQVHTPDQPGPTHGNGSRRQPPRRAAAKGSPRGRQTTIPEATQAKPSAGLGQRRPGRASDRRHLGAVLHCLVNPKPSSARVPATWPRHEPIGDVRGAVARTRRTVRPKWFNDAAAG